MIYGRPFKCGFYKVVTDSLPAYKHEEGNAGYDMYVTEDTWIFPFKVSKIPLNFRGEIPQGYYGLATSRSGESLKGNILIPGIIDSTYRGVIHALVTRIGFMPRKIKKGTRISQLIIMPYEEIKWIPKEYLSETSRSDKGFGSTGVE